MNDRIVSDWPAARRLEFGAHLDSWRRTALRTDPIDLAEAQLALSRLYTELTLPAPETYLRYASPAEALADFAAWAGRTGSITVNLWPYQLPLFAPSSYWRESHRDQPVDLAVRRRPNRHGCWSHGESIPGAPGSILDLRLHGEIWLQSADLESVQWCQVLGDRLYHDFAGPLDELERRLSREDPTCQASLDEFLLLGPFSWLLREITCASYAMSALGCRWNHDLFDALQRLLQTASLVLTFSRLCIVCDRPSRIDGQGLLEFRDGYRLENVGGLTRG
jgi:hypothetical protein